MGDNEDAIGPDVVQTTSHTAAKALAAFYSQQERDQQPTDAKQGDRAESAYVAATGGQENGKPVYRIKSRPRELVPADAGHAGGQPIFAMTEQPPSPTEAQLARETNAHPTLRLSRSFGAFRSKTVKPITPDAQGFYRPSPPASPQKASLPNGATFAPRVRAIPTPIAGRSAPSVSNGDLTRQREQRDVLGNLLGWRGSHDEALIHVAEPGKLSVQRPTTPEPPESGPSSPATPQRPVSPAAARLASPSARSSPFGDGVRGMKELSRSLSRSRRGDVPSPLQLSKQSQHSSSLPASAISEPVQEEAQQPVPKRRRYEDPAVYDVFQALEEHASAVDTSLLRHSKTLSTVSFESDVSDASRATAHQITVVSAPGDDPRFVIWGERKLPVYERKVSVGSDASSPPARSSRRWSFHKERRKSIGGDTASPVSSFTTQRVVMAATVERWIAELTSKIDDELVSAFFLTYRHFLTPRDLLQALMTRFDWALAPASRPEDEAGKRIARVRTFLVVRHWLLNYFQDDFASDRELRNSLCDWLNSLSKMDRIRESPKDHQLIKSLKKVVRRTKDKFAYGIPLSPTSDASEFSGSRASLNYDSDAGRSSLRLSTVHETIPERPSVEERLRPADSDVDLDIDVDKAMNVEGSPTLTRAPTYLLPATPPRTRRKASDPATPPSPGKSGSPKRTPKRSPSGSGVNSPTGPGMPNGHGKVSRAVSSTVGHLGRFKRMLGSRQDDGPTGGIEDGGVVQDGEIFYAELGSKQYTTVFDAQDDASSRSANLSDSASSFSPASSSGVDTPAVDSDFARQQRIHIADAQQDGLGISSTSESVDMHDGQPPELHHQTSSQTIKTISEAMPPTDGRIRPLFASTLITQDGDLDLSDSEDEVEDDTSPALRRLPAARNLKQAVNLRALFPRKSSDSMASIATGRTASFWRRSTSPAPSEAGDQTANGPLIVNNFVVQGLDSDDEEPGDVEAALRRLEGQISESKKAEIARRVELQLKKSAAVAARRKGMSHTRHSAAVESGESEEEDNADERSHINSTAPSIQSSSDRDPLASSVHSVADSALPATAEEQLDPPTVTITSAPSETGSLHEPATPSEPLKVPIVKRKPSIRNLFTTPFKSANISRLRPPAPAAPAYHSFVLQFKSELVAQQFALIERDLFLGIGWYELLKGSWRHRPVDEVLNWESFLKRRRKEIVEARARGDPDEPREIQDAITHFNLVANWCSSEIVLTAHLEERISLVNKLIRLAWKAYRHSNFQTLMQIVLGLQSPHVERLRKTWSRIGVWERRVFDDLKAFTAPFGNFSPLRRVMTGLMEDWGPLGTLQGVPSPNAQRLSRVGDARVQGCVPFFGIFLRDLAFTNELPTYLDPSSPSASIEDPDVLEQPAQPVAFGHLPPLPADVPLRPLVNVHKQRTLATIVEKVLVFQEMASAFPFEADTVLFRKCFALSCLPAEMMQAYSLRCEAD